jgi:hypothetical protein
MRIFHHYVDCHYDERQMLLAVMLSVVILSIVMLNVVVLSVGMLSVMAPSN